MNESHTHLIHIPCTVLQCVAVCCSVLQCVAVCCSVLQCVRDTSHTHPTHIAAVRCGVLQCVAVCCSALWCVAVRYGMLQCVAACCGVLQCVWDTSHSHPTHSTAVRCGVLQLQQLRCAEAVVCPQHLMQILHDVPCHTCEQIYWRILTSHAPHMNESRHTYD